MLLEVEPPRVKVEEFLRHVPLLGFADAAIFIRRVAERAAAFAFYRIDNL